MTLEAVDTNIMAVLPELPQKPALCNERLLLYVSVDCNDRL